MFCHALLERHRSRFSQENGIADLKIPSNCPLTIPIDHHLMDPFSPQDFSKIEAGKMDLEKIEFSLRSQLEHAVSVLAVRASKRNVELLCDVSPDVPDRLLGDPGRLFQIFVNLIGGRAGVISCASSARFFRVVSCR